MIPAVTERRATVIRYKSDHQSQHHSYAWQNGARHFAQRFAGSDTAPSTCDHSSYLSTPHVHSTCLHGTLLSSTRRLWRCVRGDDPSRRMPYVPHRQGHTVCVASGGRPNPLPSGVGRRIIHVTPISTHTSRSWGGMSEARRTFFACQTTCEIPSHVEAPSTAPQNWRSVKNC
ncbi:hypothetical protein ACJJTC_003353 [Scirpophaga incertulas]